MHVGPACHNPRRVKAAWVLRITTHAPTRATWVLRVKTHAAIIHGWQSSVAGGIRRLSHRVARCEERRRWRGEEEDGAEEARDPDASSAGHEQTDRHFPFSEVGLGHSDPAMNYEVVSPGGPGPGPSCTEWV